MNPAQKTALLDLSMGSIDAATFLSIYGIASDDLPREVTRLLEQAASTQDGEAVEFALLLGAHFTIPNDTITLIHKLLVQEWHTSHEEMIRLLQHWRNPASVLPLQQAIHLKPELNYLDYDDYGAYYKKCLWALVAIGTPEAISVIKECAASNESVLREQAVYRLGKLDYFRR